MSLPASEHTPRESFDQAVLRFKDFLAHRGFSPNVVWIEPSDVALTEDRRLFVYHTEQESAAIAARKAFDQGLDEGFGVVLKGLFPKKDATYCFVWFPRDRAEAEHEMVSPGVKLQVNISDTFKAVIIRSRERWEALSQRHGSIRFMKTDLFR